MSNDPIPTHQQGDALRWLVRRGAPLTHAQRDTLARLLDEISWTVQTCAKAEQRYPDSPELRASWLAACWESVSARYGQLLAAVAPPTVP